MPKAGSRVRGVCVRTHGCAHARACVRVDECFAAHTSRIHFNAKVISMLVVCISIKQYLKIMNNVEQW